MIETLFASLYKKTPEIHRTWALETITSLVFKPKEVLLQIGSNDGFVTSILSTLVPEGQVLGLEKETPLLEEAKKNFFVPNIKFLNESIETFKSDILFDKIIGINLTNEIRDPKHALKNIFDLLKSKGKLIATVLLINLKKTEGLLLKVLQDEKWKGHFPTSTPLTKNESENFWQNSLLEAGFTHADLKVETLSYSFENEFLLINWILELAKLGNLNEQQSQEFVKDIIASLKEASQETPYATIYFSEIKIEAKKD